MNKCLTCNKQTKNPKFCSRSCAAVTNNKLVPKRKPEGKCKMCNKIITSGRSYCSECWNTNDFLSIIKNKDKSIEHHAKVILNRAKLQNWHRRVRITGRIKYLKLHPNPKCERCGYDKYIEVCHIIGLKEFEKENINYKIVNDILNLVGLCRNCHWEFDKGLFPITEIKRFKLSSRP